jgi:dolichol-phosphate mannosyltransferase
MEYYKTAYYFLDQYHKEMLKGFRSLLAANEMTLTIVIPTKNEYMNLKKNLEKIIPYGDQIIIMDADNDERTKFLAREYNVEFQVQKEPGKGSALRESRQYIKSDITLFIDGDGSHDPREIPRIVTPIILGEADHITPSRMKGGSDELFNDIPEFIRLMGQGIITLGINYYFHVRLTDSQNGYRALRTDLLKSLELKEKITTIEQEMVIKTMKMGKTIKEVVSHENVRLSGTSTINIKKVFFRYIYSWLKYLLFYKVK